MLGLSVPEDSQLVGVFVRELGLPHGSALSLVIRQGAAVVPHPEMRLRSGDQLVVVSTEAERGATERRLRALSRHGRLALWQGDRGESD
jgi:cell volume regulation protein A